MPFYYYFFILILFSLLILLLRTFVPGTKSVSDKLFAEALKNENDGKYEAAVVTYRHALEEIKKRRFQQNLKEKIDGKLKLLDVIIKYQDNLRFTR